MSADVIVIGAGLSGLTAASLLAKSGLKVIVVDQAYCPGGTCGSFVRRDTVYRGLRGGWSNRKCSRYGHSTCILGIPLPQCT